MAEHERVRGAGLPLTGALRVGTSGWTYKHWRGGFYPEKLAQSRWFAHYAEAFDTAEINATFYRLPNQATVAAWREKAPDGFVFAWKASRYLTHMKRLLDPAESLERIYAPMRTLGAKLGPCLIQLPPSMHLDLERLEAFLPLLPTEHRHTIEFRHPSWYVDPVFTALEQAGVALCVSDHHHAPAPFVVTAPFAYVRGHGPTGQYWGAYSEETLQAWAETIRSWRAGGLDVYAYFDNDIGGAAPFDATKLRAMAGLI